MDGIPELGQFADKLEKACLDVLEEGIMTKDLAGLAKDNLAAKGITVQEVDSETYLKTVRARMEREN